MAAWKVIYNYPWRHKKRWKWFSSKAIGKITANGLFIFVIVNYHMIMEDKKYGDINSAKKIKSRFLIHGL